MSRLGFILALSVAMHAHLAQHEQATLAMPQLVSAHHADDHDHPTTRSADPTAAFHPIVTVSFDATIAPARRTVRFRDTIALSALRIDDDVGLHALIHTYLI